MYSTRRLTYMPTRSFRSLAGVLSCRSEALKSMVQIGVTESNRKRRQQDAADGAGVEAKRKLRRGEEEEEKQEGGGRRDPLEALGADIMMRIFELSDACSVARCTVVSRGWHEIAVSDRLWAPKCMELLKGKAHIPRISNLRGASRLAAYSMAIMDGKRVKENLAFALTTCGRITKEDLCDHVWEFCFSEHAPEYWRSLDPSWKGTGPPMRRYFHPNGSHTAEPDDQVWGGHECTYSIMTCYVGEGKIRDHYVRINRWPAMAISRNEDWSWEMRNHLYCYNSIPDVAKEGGTGPLFPAWY